MGVNVERVILLGAKFTCEELDYDQVEKFETSYWKEHHGFATLYDGMNGEYVMAGHIVARSWDRQEYIFDGPLELVVSPEQEQQVISDLKEKLGVQVDNVSLFYVEHHT